MAITVHEFDAFPNANGEFSWPAARTTRNLATGGTHTTTGNTRSIVITTDANARVSFDGVAAGAGDVPLLASIENSYLFADPGAHVLKFL